MALAALAVVCAAPLLTVAAELLGGGEERSRAAAILSDIGAWRLFGRGVLVAAGSALAATVLGAGLALAGIPKGGRWLVVLGLAPLLAPPTVYGLSWKSTADCLAGALGGLGFGGSGRASSASAVLEGAGCALVMGMAFAPLVALAGLAARRLQDPAALEAARLAGVGRGRRLLRVEISHILEPLVGGALAVFLLSFSQFEIPSALNYPSLAEEIYAKFQESYSVGAPAALAFFPILPAIGLGILVWGQVRRLTPLGASSYGRKSLEINGLGPWLGWSAFVALAGGLPAAGLIWRGMDRQALQAMGPDLIEGLRDTLPSAVAGTVACLGMAWVLADLALERRVWGGLALCAVLATAAVAPAVLGIGIIRFWSRPPLEALVYGRSAAWVLAWIARFLAVPFLAFVAARRMLGREFVEAARTAGVPERVRHGRLLAPALGATLAAAAGVCLALMLGELGAAALLSAPGVELICQRLHSRVHIGPQSQVAALSLLYGATTLGIAALAWGAGRWALDGKGRS